MVLNLTFWYYRLWSERKHRKAHEFADNEEIFVKGKRKERLAALNREIILESAHKLFLEKGIPGTTMYDIAKEVGCSKTTIYTYFESKEELVNYLFFEGINFFQTQVHDEAGSSRDFKDFYTQFCASVVALHKKQPVYYEGVAGEAIFDETAPPENILNKIYLSGEVNMATIEQCITKALKEKEIVLADGIDETLMFMWFCIMGIVEKSALKDSYVKHKLGKDREEFLAFAFEKLFSLLKRH